MEGYNSCSFIDMVGRDFQKIRNCFMKGLHKYNMRFDDDVFSETLLKCNERLSGITIDYEIAIRYFWTSFRNNSLKKKNNKIDYTDNINVHDSIPDTIYNPKMDIIYEIVFDAIAEEFGVILSTLWRDHIVYGKTYEELQEKTKIENLHYQFRRIRNYIRTTLPEINKDFKELINEND